MTLFSIVTFTSTDKVKMVYANCVVQMAPNTNFLKISRTLVLSCILTFFLVRLYIVCLAIIN